MPHIRIRALTKEQVQTLSQTLAKELAPLMSTTEDNFSIERVETEFFANGKSVEGDPTIEVAWFDRGQDVQDQSAKLITSKVSELSKSTSICIIFTALPKSAYYENGGHF